MGRDQGICCVCESQTHLVPFDVLYPQTWQLYNLDPPQKELDVGYPG